MNGDSFPAERLTLAMDVWLRHRQAPDCSAEELLLRHPELDDLLQPLIEDARSQGQDPTIAASEQRFGSYRLAGELGRGGVGIVYDAVQDPLGRCVALKVLADPLLQQPQAVARFRREGELLARLRHPHIVPIYDAGVVDGVPFHAMERIDGVSLNEVLLQLHGRDRQSCDGSTLGGALRAALAAKGDAREAELEDDPFGPSLCGGSHVEACVRLALAIAEALAAAHSQGILHRDVKPANILMRRDGTVLLSDFGLARDLREPGLTQQGGFVGTPAYVSPEQAEGWLSDVDQRSDVFSLAVVLYELLLLVRPFAGDTTEQVIEQVRKVDPRALLRRAKGLPADLLAVLECALQRRREDRYDNMAMFAAELASVLALRPVRARRRGLVSRFWQGVRRRPKQATMWLGLTASLVAAIALGTHLAMQQTRIAVGLQKEVTPQVERDLNLALLELEGGNFQGVVRRVAAAAQLLPELPLVLAAQAHVARVTGDMERARSLVARLAETAPLVAEQLQPDTASEPESSLGWFVRGFALLATGHRTGDVAEYRRAAQALRRAIDRSSEPRLSFHCQYLHALTHVHDWQAVREMASDVGHLWPDSAVAAYWRGFALTAVDPVLAEPELQRAAVALPGIAAPLQRLAKLQEVRGDLEAAEITVRKLLSDHPSDKLPRLILARLLRKQRRAADAAVILDELQVEWPGTYRVPMERAASLLSLGRFEAALVAADAAVAKAPGAATTHERRGHVLLKLRRFDDALAELQAATDLAPNNYDIHKSRAAAFIQIGRWQDAAASLRRVVELNPRDQGSWCDLAAIWRRCDDLDAAEAALAEAEKLDPDHWLLHLQRAHVLQARKRPADARVAFQLAADGNRQHGEALINLANFHLQAREYEQCLALLAEARSRQPRLWQAWRPAISILTWRGRYGEAEALLAVWCKQHPKDASRWLQLAALRRKSDQHGDQSAQQAWQQAAQLLGRDHPMVLAERGQQLLVAGDKQQARALFARVVAMKKVSAKTRAACQSQLEKLGK